MARLGGSQEGKIIVQFSQDKTRDLYFPFLAKLNSQRGEIKGEGRRGKVSVGMRGQREGK